MRQFTIEKQTLTLGGAATSGCLGGILTGLVGGLVLGFKWENGFHV